MFKNFFKIKTLIETEPINGAEKVEVKKVIKKPVLGLLKQQSFIGSLELYSPTWNFINSHLNNHLADLRKKNDNTVLSFDKTQVLRGQIKEIKLLLAILHEQTVSKYIEPEV